MPVGEIEALAQLERRVPVRDPDREERRCGTSAHRQAMLPTVASPILGVATSTTGLVGEAAQGPVEQAVLVTSLVEFEQVFGMPQAGQELFLGVRQFFLNGGVRAWTVRLGARSAAGIRRGLAALDAVDDLGLQRCEPT